MGLEVLWAAAVVYQQEGKVYLWVFSRAESVLLCVDLGS